MKKIIVTLLIASALITSGCAANSTYNKAKNDFKATGKAIKKDSKKAYKEATK